MVLLLLKENKSCETKYFDVKIYVHQNPCIY